MSEWLNHEAAIRLGAFACAVVALALLQWHLPLRGDGRPARRQLTNLGLVVIDTLLLRLAFPVLAVAWAVVQHNQGHGLFARVDAPAWLEILAAIVLLDLVIYWQHRLFHRVPVLWRLHRVHHADTAFDLTTGVRFHPLEILVSMGIKLAAIRVLGADPAAVLLFELVLNLGSLWTHSDFALPRAIDRRLRWLIVTPSMHRIHHSVLRNETDSNYGFHLSVWDRLFGSYTKEPQGSEASMLIGLERFRSDREQGLIALLLNPLRSERPASETQKSSAADRSQRGTPPGNR
jgi:sterol desaturase/sphingolipid hydroxylase (fatty acid hydroxylase superfamily)